MRGRSSSLSSTSVLKALIGVVSVSVAVAGLQSPAFADPVASSASSPTQADETQRLDSVSAQVTARVTGHRVEDLSQRDEFTRVYANPDGTWTSETASAPESVLDQDGVWHEVDTTLVQTDGGFAPRYAVGDLVVSAGGDGAFAEMEIENREVAWTWPRDLPAPDIDGNTATYRGAVAGGDLVVTALPSGFRHDIVLREPPADPGEVSFAFPVDTDGAVLSEGSDGGLTLETKSGDALFSAPAPVMWDASDSDGVAVAGGPTGGVPADTAPLETTVTPGAGGAVVRLSPDPDFLADPDTVYPVTIDPSYSQFANNDTHINNASPTSVHPWDTRLLVGTDDGGATRNRTLMSFPYGKWDRQSVTSASLLVRNYKSLTCNGKAVQAARITSAWDNGTVNWNNQPSVTTAGADNSSAAYGYTGCDAADMQWNVTAIVQAWATHDAPNYGVRLAAVDGTLNGSYREFRSENYGVGNSAPRLSVTYNSYPNTAGTPEVSPGNTGYSTSTTPTLKATVSDPDGGELRGKFTVYNSAGTAVWTGYSCPSISSATCTSSGGTASVGVPAAANLADGATYTAKGWAQDATGDLSKAASSIRTFTVDTSVPTAPAITASGYSAGEWLETAPASNTFTLNGVGDVATLSYSQDDGAWKTLAADASGDATLSWTPTTGYHTLAVEAIDKAGNTSPQTTFSFGVGGLAFSAPATGGRSTGTFPVGLSGKPDATGANLQWRYAGDTGASSWVDATEVKTSAGADWAGTAPNNADGDAAVAAGLLWDPTAEPAVGDRDQVEAPALLEIRGCFTYATAPTEMCSAARLIQLVPSGFGGSMPTTDAGPAAVALTTGEFTIGAGDAADTPAGVGRMFSSFDVTTVTDGVFGPGWSSMVADPMTEAATATLLDQRDTVADNAGPFVLQQPDGTTDTYAPTGTAGEYAPVDPGVDSDTRRLVFTDPATGPDLVTLSEDQGATTTWNNASGAWLLERVDGPQDAGVTTYSWDANRHLVWIGEDAPAGVTCTVATQQPGCRGLKLTYTGTGSATRVAAVARVAYDPAPNANGLPGSGAGMATTTVAEYTYNTAGELTQVCDPRPAVDLCTGYSYTSLGGRTLLATMTPPGQIPWRFDYDSEGRLATVKRAVTAATGTGDAVWTMAYDVSPAASGLPDLSAAAAAQWGQEALPTQAAAVFGPDHVPSGAPGASDWPHATVWYATDDGTQTNVAVYGAGQWLLDTVWHDQQGNIVQTLDGAGRARALAQADPARRATVALEASSLTIYNNDGDDDPTGGDGTRLIDEYGPAHTATLTDGTDGLFRTHTHYIYDDDPAGQNLDPTRPPLSDDETSFGLVVEEQHSVATADQSSDHDTRLVRYEYSPNAPGDGNGWLLGVSTRTMHQTENGWSTSVTRFDTDGQILETRQPGGAATNGVGTDAHATKFVYYTADASSPDDACDNQPAWDGLPCIVGPAAQPAGAPMPVTYTLGYNRDSQPTRVEDRSGPTTRTTVTGYDNLSRISTTETTVSGGDASDPSLPATSLGYDASTGLPATQTAAGSTLSTGYDTWGRPTSYIDALGMPSATTYTRAGQVATFNDGSGLYTYGYDNSNEHRGLPTSVDVGLATGPDMFTLTYNAAGAQASIGYPNGTTATYGYDEAGVPTSLDYANGGDPLLSFTATTDVEGRVRGYTSIASAQAYTYDQLGRLTRTEDTRDGPCTTRTYGFSASSERTSYASYDAAPDGACQSATATVSKTNTYDTANRISNAGYTYDNLGRTRTTPAADTAPGAAGPLTSTYFPNDMIASLTQNVDDGAGGSVTKRTSYSLDPTGRINAITNLASGNETSRTRYRFSTPGDAPTAVETSNDTGTTWIRNRYLQVPGLGMAGAVTAGNTTLQLANLHGDVVATQANTLGNSGIDSYAESDEYGNSLTGTPGAYGWLGAHQRSNDSVGGIVHMGARAYNPATGQFLTKDPVKGGNATQYTYPQDPVNQFDLDGRICILGHGTCDREAPRFSGAVVGIHSGIWSKVTGYHAVPGWLVYRAIYWAHYGYFNSQYAPYRFRVWERICDAFGCRLGRSREIRVIINWYDGRSNHGWLVTMYCQRPGSKQCDDWIQDLPPYLGPPGPQW